jgi:hypothetical protein
MNVAFFTMMTICALGALGLFAACVAGIWIDTDLAGKIAVTASIPFGTGFILAAILAGSDH